VETAADQSLICEPNARPCDRNKIPQDMFH
jgi:hypothetical protein